MRFSPSELVRGATITALGRFMQLFFRGGSPRPFRDLCHREVSLLVIKPCSIGDVLMATPMLKAFREGLPNAKLSLSVGTWSKVAVANNPDIDELIDCGEIGTPRRYGLSMYVNFAQRLRSRQFDAAVVADRSPMMSLLPFLAGVPVRIGIDSYGRGFSLTNKVPIRDGVHESDLYLDIARLSGLNVADMCPRFYPTADDHRAGERIFEEWGLRGRRVLIVAPGGGSNPGADHYAKRWDPACFAESADRLAVNSGFKPLLIGQETDAEAARMVALLMREEVVNLVGQTSFGQLGALMRLSSAYVGNDSAPSHLAAAMGMPSVTVFVCSDPRRFRPIGPNSMALSAGDSRRTIEAVVDSVLRLTK